MKTHHFFRSLVLWGMIASGTNLTACSSSSDSNSSSGGGNNGPDDSQPFPITEQTALEAAQVFTESLYFIEIFRPLWVPMEDFAGVAETTSQSVASGNGEIRVTVVPTQQRITLTLDFEQALEEGFSIDGQLQQRQNRDTFNQRPFGTGYIYGELIISDLNIQGPNIDAEVNGSIRFDHSSQTWHINATATDSVTGETLELNNFQQTRSQESHFSFAYTDAFQGSVIDTEGNRLTVATEQPLAELRGDDFDGADQAFLHARQGRISLTGDETLHLAVSNDAFVTLLLNTAGQDLKGQIREWRELSENAPVLQPESKPVVGAVIAGSYLDQVGHPLAIHGLLSSTRDSEFVTYEWHKVYAPSGSSAPESLTGPFLEFTPDRPGDYIYDLVVTQGEDVDHERVAFFAANETVAPYRVWLQSNAVVRNNSSDGTTYDIFLASRLENANLPTPPNEWQVEHNGFAAAEITATNLAAFTARVQSGAPITGQHEIVGRREGTPSSTVRAPFYGEHSQLHAVELIRRSASDNGAFYRGSHYFDNEQLHLIYREFDLDTIEIHHAVPENQSDTLLGSLEGIGVYSWLQYRPTTWPRLVAATETEQMGAIGFSVWETRTSELIDASTPMETFTCESPFNNTSFTMANIVGNDELELLTAHPCSNDIYYWEKDNEGRYANPQVLYTPADSEAEAGVIAPAHGLAGSYDDVVINLGATRHLLNGGQPLPLESIEGETIYQIVNAQNKSGVNRLFALFFDNDNGVAYVRTIDKNDGEATLGTTIELINRSAITSQPISSLAITRHDDNAWDDLLVVFENLVIIVSDYEVAPVARVYQFSETHLFENRSVSSVDINGDDNNDVVIGGTVYIVNPNL